jgi:hypothetical protein
MSERLDFVVENARLETVGADDTPANNEMQTFPENIFSRLRDKPKRDVTARGQQCDA